MLKTWNKTLNKLSGNLTTNSFMPKGIKEKLLDEDIKLRNKFKLEEVN